MISVDVGCSILKQILKAIPKVRILKPINDSAFDDWIIKTAFHSREKGFFLESNGFVKTEHGKWIFVDSELDSECDGYTVVLSETVKSKQLLKSHDYKDRTEIMNMLREMRKNQNTAWTVFIYTLLSSMRTLIEKFELSTFPLLFVVGSHNLGKSMLIKRYCLLYNKSGSSQIYGEYEANSTELGLTKEIARIANQVILIDDLNKSSDPGVTAKRLQLIGEMIHFASNNNKRLRATQKEASQKCRTGVAISSEISLTAASDLTRVIEIVLKESLPGKLKATRADADPADWSQFRL